MTTPLWLRGFKLISLESMEGMHTGTLMRPRKEMLQLHDTQDMCDLSKEEIEQLDTSHTIYFKTDARWDELYTQLKSILCTRENWPPVKQKQ